MLEICKASAGSGKTYKLTHDYIDKLMQGGKEAFRHILAVTFTNKATDEMKQRILSELHKMGADEILIEILNDYNSFNICTIDKFFQKVLRSFAREVGQWASYNVELNRDAVINEALDNMMDSLEDEQKSELINWLIKLSINSIEDGKSWKPLPALQKLGKELFSEDFIIKSGRIQGGAWADKEKVELYREQLIMIKEEFVRKLKDIGQRAMKLIGDFSLEIKDFSGASKSSFIRLQQWANGEVIAPSHTLITKSEGDVDGYYSKSCPSKVKEQIRGAYNAGLSSIVKEGVELFNAPFVEYTTADIILSDLFTLGLLDDISREIADYCKKKNIVVLSKTTDFLNKVIDGSDTPFIYEKIGSWIDHYMLDEFQDTSLMQWDNFLPLVKDSVDGDKANLIVGDVKQSIYRWRNSDWKLLNSEIYKGFNESTYTTNILDSNWRSLKNIVDFNNDFFIKAARVLQRSYNELSGYAQNTFITSIYTEEDVIQKLPQRDNFQDGYVKLSFIKKEEQGWDSAVFDRLYEVVLDCISRGYRANDIAFLVRKNDQGSALAEYFIKKEFMVITEDSLLISASTAVNKIVTALKFNSQRDDSISKFLFKSGSVQTQEKSLYHICEEVIRQMSESEKRQSVFIQAFMDCVLDYISINGSDISGFLKWWDEVGRKRSISAPEGIDALNIMTVHKSKGLGFKVTILPFVEEKFNHNGDSVLWCTPSIEPFNMLPLIPLKASSNLKNTIFNKEYMDEVLYSYVDTLNLLYVAFTRAKEELYIFAPLPEPNDKGVYKCSDMSDVLFECYRGALNDDNIYEIGDTITAQNQNNVDIVSTLQENGSFVSIPIGDRLKLSYTGESFFSEDNPRSRGIVMHDILAGVSSEDDLEGKVKEAVLEGTILSSEGELIKSTLLCKIASVRDRHWFDGTYSHYNESTIINGNGEMYRPDRIMIGADEAIIVDYKFGKHHRNSYRHQVENYKSLIMQMGYSKVSAYLWYLEDDVIEEW